MANVALENLSALVQDVLERLPRNEAAATVVTLQGELGAGKTTFMQAFAKALGVTDTVQSPTYVLMKTYPISRAPFKTLVHIDAYRLEKPEEFVALKPETFLTNPENLVCIEWPEKVAGILPTPEMVITFSAEGVGERERSIELA